MKVRHTLICFFVLTLQAGNIFITAGRRILKPTEGGRVTVACSFTSSGDRKFFCKEECKEEILIETTGDQAENGRYRIDYTETFFLSYPVLYVSITQLSKADSGRYSCGLGTPLFPDSHEEFEIIVRDAPTTSKSNWTLQPSSASVPSASTPKITQALSSSSGSFTFSSASPKTTTQSETATTSTDPAPTTSKPNLTLRPSSASIPSTSTPKTTLSLSSSSRSFTTSSAPTKTTKQQQKTESATSPTDPAPTTSKPNWTLRPSSASVPSTSTPKTTLRLSSSSRSFTTSSAPPKTTKQLRQQKSERATSLADPRKLLYVCLLLVLMVFLSSLAVMLFCRKRANKPEEGHLNHQASVPEAYRVGEDIREDRQSRSPPMEMSSVYTHAKYTKLSGVETNVDHCVADLN